MECLYLRKRQQNYQSYLYCTKLKRKITFDKCKNCLCKQYKAIKKIKKQTKKQKKAEKNRFSIIQKDMSICFFCGKSAESIHELIGGINRQKSMKWGLCVGACLDCHRLVEDKQKIKQKYQILGQKAFIKKYGFDLFIKEFGQDYSKKEV